MFGRQNLEHEIRGLLNGTLSHRRSEALRRRLVEDDDARIIYDRLAEAEAALEPAAERLGLGIAGTERVQRRLFATLESTAPTPVRWPWTVKFAWGALGALGVAVAVVGVDPALEDPTGGYARRSGVGRSLDADHVLQVLRVTFDAWGEVSVDPAKRLVSGDHLRFAVFSRNRSGRLSVLAVRAGARELLLDRAPIVSSSRAKRLDLSFAIPPSWSGPVRFVAVFDHAGTIDPATVSLESRDEADLSVREVFSVIEESP